jgi:hypothetical protein
MAFSTIGQFSDGLWSDGRASNSARRLHDWIVYRYTRYHFRTRSDSVELDADHRGRGLEGPGRLARGLGQAASRRTLLGQASITIEPPR